jgi:hypothetical protein
MWKRIAAVVALALVIAVTAAGCGAKKQDSGTKVTPADGTVTFETVDEKNWPADVKDWVEAATRGQTQALNESKTFGDQTYLLVYAGERSSGGYTVVFDKVEAKGGTVTVTAHVAAPSGMATTVISYPLAVARIPRYDGTVQWTVTMGTK